MLNIHGFGNLTADAIQRPTGGESVMLTFRVASNRPDWLKYEGQPETDYIDCFTFVKPGSGLIDRLKKGNRVHFHEGQLLSNDYTDSNGATRTGFNLRLKAGQLMVTPKQPNDQYGAGMPPQGPPPVQQQQYQQPPQQQYQAPPQQQAPPAQQQQQYQAPPAQGPPPAPQGQQQAPPPPVTQLPPQQQQQYQAPPQQQYQQGNQGQFAPPPPPPPVQQ